MPRKHHRQLLIETLDALNALSSDFGMKVGILECYPLCSYLDQAKYPFASERKCSAGVTTCSVGSNGDVRACSHDGKIYGNIHSDGLTKSWDNMSEWRSGDLLPVVCKSCPVFSFCSGGCRVDAEYVNGRKCKLDPYVQPENIKRVITESKSFESVADLRGKDLMVSDDLRFRHEQFCVLCATEKRVVSPMPLTSDTYELLMNFEGSSFTIEDVSCYTDLDSSVADDLCRALVLEGIIGIKP
jgi:radical SAM protein with 4Fe4S-binding SPASM domain